MDTSKRRFSIPLNWRGLYRHARIVRMRSLNQVDFKWDTCCRVPFCRMLSRSATDSASPRSSVTRIQTAWVITGCARVWKSVVSHVCPPTWVAACKRKIIYLQVVTFILSEHFWELPFALYTSSNHIGPVITDLLGAICVTHGFGFYLLARHFNAFRELAMVHELTLWSV